MKKLIYTTIGVLGSASVFAESDTVASLATPDTSSIESNMILAGGALIGLAVTFGGIKLVINMIRGGISGGR